jgi:hypothetical protein
MDVNTASVFLPEKKIIPVPIVLIVSFLVPLFVGFTFNTKLHFIFMFQSLNFERRKRVASK